MPCVVGPEFHASLGASRQGRGKGKGPEAVWGVEEYSMKSLSEEGNDFVIIELVYSEKAIMRQIL